MFNFCFDFLFVFYGVYGVFYFVDNGVYLWSIISRVYCMENYGNIWVIEFSFFLYLYRKGYYIMFLFMMKIGIFDFI